MATADDIAQLCYETFNALPHRGKPEPGREWTLLAAVVKVTRCANSDTVEKEVVSLGTGTKCIGQTAMSPKGDVLNDSHAEVIARRGCIRYLTQQLHRAVSGRGSHVFCRATCPGKWRLQPGVSFLFFTSHTPCGDASIIPMTDKQPQPCTSMKSDQGTAEGSFKRKSKAGTSLKNSKRLCREERYADEEKTDDAHDSEQSSRDSEPSPSPPVKTPIVDGRQDCQLPDIHRTGAKSVRGGPSDPLQPRTGYHTTGLLRVKPGRGELTLSLSCSDKLARWGVLGFQGALLSHYLEEALYFRTVVVGMCPYSQASMQRALYTRCSHVLDLCAGFSVCPPVFLQSKLEFPFSQAQTELQHMAKQGRITPCGAAISWCKVPDQPLDVTASGYKQGVTKKALGTAKARSALCKLELFHSFLSLVSATKASALPDSLRRTDLHTYLDYKEASETYQQAWQQLRSQAFPLWPRSDRNLLLFQ
ncbi:tRNA-specific adenosine deaminase 1 isoform X2 [Dunckerocampus dactyliophorus]|uniref:tRNA-specific adenosine deaminase 1 isoform X2 n=1 Tax=Dunckerocampus dactyliophorus TaxID=161453 RepID=UPI0024052394|nr:tRNA-specific adenosine deaminase 1 isoform X2 [Dunckerocampus dactyliophorus]